MSTLPGFPKLVTQHGIMSENDTQLVNGLERMLKQNDSFKDRFYQALHEEYTISEMMSVIVGLDYMMKQCITLAPGEYFYTNCAIPPPHKQYIKDDRKCYQFSADIKDGKSTVYHVDRFNLNGFLYRFTFINIKPSLEQLVIYIHPETRKPNGRVDLPAKIENPAHMTECHIAFSRYITKLPPYPHKSNCFNYKISRYYEIDACVRNKSIEQGERKVPPWIVMNSDIQVKVFYPTNITRKEVETFIELTENCWKIWKQPDCTFENIATWLDAYKSSDEIGSLRVYIDVPKYNQHFYEEVPLPLRTITDILIEIGSSLGFWFGFYVSGLFSASQMVTQKFVFRARNSIFRS